MTYWRPLRGSSLHRKLLLAVCLLSEISSRAESSSADIEFFEKKIRPVLVERCFKCHSAESEKLKGGLRLDSREGMLKGGETRPALVPGDPERSLMIEAISYRNSDLQMPPKGKLADREIADFTAWVKLGAPWPASSEAKDQAQKVSSFDIDRRRREHWAWKEIGFPMPPSVRNESWINNSVDRFILVELEKSNLNPAPPAEKATLLRRVYFDLIGLPPTPGEVEAYLNDSSPRAFERVVDGLLASPRFGERWARHWLDLVRYAETLGHEFDYAVQHAWRYRDYVIRAFNADVPYHQFVTEHIAGDLLSDPRRHPTERFNESIVATAFFWLGQRDHSPVDVRQHQAELIDNQIDVTTKTFLGLTVACARCHDHKFDAISTRDFYSLYGVLESSRYAQRAIDPPELVQRSIRRLEQIKGKIRHELAATWSEPADAVRHYLLAATRVISGQNQLTEEAATLHLDTARLGLWIDALRDSSETRPPKLLSIWSKLARQTGLPAQTFQKQWQNLVAEANEAIAPIAENDARYELFADFSGGSFQSWFVDGEAFGAAPRQAGELIVGGTNKPLSLLREPAAHSAGISRRLQGALRSTTFDLNRRFIHILASGRESRINLFIDNLTMIRDPIYGGLKKQVNSDAPKWITMDVGMWQGHRAYLEFSDITTPDPSEDGKKIDPLGFIAVNRVVFSDQSSPPPAPRPQLVARVEFNGDNIDTIEAFALESQRMIARAIESWRDENSSAGNGPAQTDMLVWMVERGLLGAFPPGRHDSAGERLASLLDEFRKSEEQVSEPNRVPAMVDGNGIDEYVFVRGNHKNRGETVARHFLAAIEGTNGSAFRQGSGRLELARRMTDPSNPFLARVMVNRVWHHLFGRGIVFTPDDFGVLGQPPTHPELLDWLASWYRDEASWSTKKLIRLLVTSRSYQMSSQPADLQAEEKDPSNLLWHRMPVRRLEGEAIRDGMLALSGRLDTGMFGPPVPAHLTEFMEGRGRPGRIGPLDGAGRRSIYLEVRRNFLPPMMRNFDMPVPFTTVGKRTVSNVPAQSLILMNDPFVFGQAQHWARRLLMAEKLTVEDRIRKMYFEAFCRPPTSLELTEATGFLRQQAESYSIPLPDQSTDERVWTDLCHVMLNLKEMIFLN